MGIEQQIAELLVAVQALIKKMSVQDNGVSEMKSGISLRLEALDLLIAGLRAATQDNTKGIKETLDTIFEKLDTSTVKSAIDSMSEAIKSRDSEIMNHQEAMAMMIKQAMKKEGIEKVEIANLDQIKFPNVQNVKIVNAPEPLEEVRITNEVAISKPKWYESFSYEKATNTFKTMLASLIFRVKAEDILRVNVIDKKGNIIDDFSPTVRGGGGGGPEQVGLKNSAGASINPATAENQAYEPSGKKIVVGNVRAKFYDGFGDNGRVQPDQDVWQVADDLASGVFIRTGGNSQASAYLDISLSPFAKEKYFSILTKQSFGVPFRAGFGISLSQRLRGEEIAIEAVGVNSNGDVDNIDVLSLPEKPITGATANVTLNVATFNINNHGLRGGDRVIITGCADTLLNVGPAYVTVINQNSFTVPCIAGNFTYSAVGGVVKWVDPLNFAKNGAGFVFEQTSATQASLFTRADSSKPRFSQNATIPTTVGSQTNTSPYTDAFNAASIYEVWLNVEELILRSVPADSNSDTSSYIKFSQGIPSIENEYKLRVHAKSFANKSIPVAEIVSITKTGSTIATVVTLNPHGLNSLSRVQIWGVRDQTNFPNLSSRLAVSSIVDPTTFTIIIGSSSTTSSEGGVVYDMQGEDQTMPAFAQSVQSVSHDEVGNVTTFIGSGTWATPLAGELVEVYGLSNSLSAYEGTYQVLRVSTTTLEAIKIIGTNNALTTTNCGGAVIRRTSVRVHFVKILDHTRHFVEVLGGRGNSLDRNNCVPVIMTSSVTSNPGTGTNTTQWSAAGWGGFLVNDVASAAITSTATTSAVTPGSVANIGTYAHSFNIAVTASSGTTPTLDLAIEESTDNGTNWRRIYEFPRITGTGNWTSPLIRSQYGTRFRYVQTIAGTTPSFTRSINRVQFSSNAPFVRQFIDRTIAPNTLNSTTPITGSFLGGYDVHGSEQLMLIVNMGAITTTAPQFVIEGSEDGTNWFMLSAAPLLSVASSTVTQIVSGYIPAYTRIRVSTAGSGATLGYVELKAKGS